MPTSAPLSTPVQWVRCKFCNFFARPDTELCYRHSADWVHAAVTKVTEAEKRLTDQTTID